MLDFKIKEMVLSLGAYSVGIADLSLVKGIFSHPADLLDKYKYAVSFSVSLADPIIDELITGPTPLYSYHYRVVNTMIDQISLHATNYLQAKGFKAVPVPASQLVREDLLAGMVSHKLIAWAAGLGWIGKNQLLITPERGPRIRLGTILTNAPLPADKPLDKDCGNCFICAKACPATAISGKQGYPVTVANGEVTEQTIRPLEIYNPRACEEFMLAHAIGANERICGICIRVCPQGRKAVMV